MKQEGSAYNLQNSSSQGSSQLSFHPPRTIVLVGLMGAGKTSIGRRLAKRLGVDFFDSDQEVEIAARCPIKDILDMYGEESFRQGECRVIKRLLMQEPHVLATGGGSFTFEPTRQMIKEQSISVWLNADLETLLTRVSRRSDRPMLENAATHRSVLTQLIEERYPIFATADVAVDTFDEPAHVTVDRVIGVLAEYIRDRYPTEYILRSM